MFSRYVVSQVKHNSYFLVGLALGLWLALSVIPVEDGPSCDTATASAAISAAPLDDDFEPHREERPDRTIVGGGRSIQRPRYYSTELGMRGSLLTGVLAGAGVGTSGGPGDRAAALNTTARQLQPALKFFITAGTRQASAGLANVVGFTDTREMLKPFHALKYLADNYLDEYDFFFLVSDTAYINARRLSELVAGLSVSQDVYMGTVDEDDSHYCSLDSGIVLSNSVLRAVHGTLDWCVRNSYSPRHHENLGRCVLHAAHIACTPLLQGESYISAKLEEPLALTPALADAVTIYPAMEPNLLYKLHAYVSRVYLERDNSEVLSLRAALRRGVRRHPPGHRNGTWPGGLRHDPGLAPPPPDSRFDHLRWTAFNATHTLMPDEHHAVAPLTKAYKDALDLVWETAQAWALRRWRWAREAALVEGSWRWEPATALRYRLLVRLTATEQSGQTTSTLRQLEVVRPLGAARLVSVPYVTESAKIALVLPVLVEQVGGQAAEQVNAEVAAALEFMQRYEAVCLNKDKNTELIVVLVLRDPAAVSAATPLREAITALLARHRTAIDVIETNLPEGAIGPVETEQHVRDGSQRVALVAALGKLQRDALLLLADSRMEFNEDFLNRVRMNSIPGSQWFLPLAFARYAQYAHPSYVQADGSRPQHHTGRYTRRVPALAVHRGDIVRAIGEWTASNGAVTASVSDILAASSLRCLRAPEPGLVLSPAPQPCTAKPELRGKCLAELRDEGDFAYLELGAKHALAKLLLETMAEVEG